MGFPVLRFPVLGFLLLAHFSAVAIITAVVIETEVLP